MKKYLLFVLFSNFSFSQVQLGNDIDGEASGDFSGSSVSLDSDGDRLAIGAYGNEGTGDDANGGSGHVRVFEWSGGSWSQLGSDIDGEAAADRFGYSVSLDSDGDRLAIGAYLNDGGGSNAGHVRVYAWNGSSWSQLGSDIDGEAADDKSGISVSLDSDGDRLAIGAFHNDGGGSNAGHVRVYAWNGSSWSQLGSDIDGEATDDESGNSICLDSDGDRLAIGALNNDGGGNSAGHVRVYEWSGGSWSQLGSDIDGEYSGDHSGVSISLDSDGDRVAIGAYGNGGTANNAGHVRVYEWSGGSWSQLGSDIDGEAYYDYSGSGVSLDSDGDRVAIGAYGNDGTANFAGHIRIYIWNGGNWIQGGSDIDGEAAFDKSGGEFGHSVSIASNGERVAIGAFQNDGGGSDAGHVRVYDTSDGALPVELTSFELLETRNDGITLQWVTESEINNLGFNLDRKTPITDWSQIASYINHPALQGQGSVSHQTIYTFTDNTVQEYESYDYRLSDVDYDGNVEYHSLQLMGVSSTSIPEQFVLYPNYPNPFNPVTTIRYDLSKESFVDIKIYDMLGNVVYNLVNANESPGYKSIQWDATDNQGEPVSAGVYLYKIQAGDFVDTKKMILLK